MPLSNGTYTLESSEAVAPQLHVHLHFLNWLELITAVIQAAPRVLHYPSICGGFRERGVGPVGGGLPGLAAATSLARCRSCLGFMHTWRVFKLEKAPSLDLLPSATRTLQTRMKCFGSLAQTTVTRIPALRTSLRNDMPTPSVFVLVVVKLTPPDPFLNCNLGNHCAIRAFLNQLGNAFVAD